jgi:hypothetical protein
LAALLKFHLNEGVCAEIRSSHKAKIAASETKSPSRRKNVGLKHHPITGLSYALAVAVPGMILPV